MSKYENDLLKEYLKTTQIITINENLKMRMNAEQLREFENHLYDTRLNVIKECIESIIKLNIKYPHNASPSFYVYIVPKENFRALLNFPDYIKTEFGGKPVKAYDLDSFKSAYGRSNNVFLFNHETTLLEYANIIHELAHLVGEMFFTKNIFLSEGFADTLAFYIFNYENKINDYKNLLCSLKEDVILSANELIEAEKNKEFNSIPMLDGKICSYSIYYISSYLFVKTCIERIEEIKNKDKISAMQEFLEILFKSKYINQYRIYEIAKDLDLDEETLLFKKTYQLKTLEKTKRTEFY